MTEPLRRSSGWITACLVALAALALAGSVQAPASPSLLPPGAIAPTDAQRATARKVGRILEEAHYSHAPIDHQMSDTVFQRYLEFLDRQRSYLLASDINEFSAYRYQFDDMIRTGEHRPGVPHVRALPAAQSRAHAVRARAAEDRARLDGERDYEFDRLHAAWPADRGGDQRPVAAAASRTTRCR